MIDLLSETTLSLAQAAAALPRGRNGAKAHLSTILRWITRGAKALSGELVRLEGVRLGGRWVTSREALQRFVERLTPDLGSPPAAPLRTSAARTRASERAAQKLERLGI